LTINDKLPSILASAGSSLPGMGVLGKKKPCGWEAAGLGVRIMFAD
jgi:hypothetical protein